MAERTRRAEALARRLLEIGADAAEAVAKGLRTRGRWRQLLLPFARAHRYLVPIRAALVLVAKRSSDGLAEQAAEMAAGCDE